MQMTVMVNVNSLGELKADMDRVYDWTNRNKLTINIDKTKAQLFPRNSNNDPQQLHLNNPITINNKPLHYEHTFWYLCVDIDDHLSMKTTRDSIYRNASHKLYIYRLVWDSMTMPAAVRVLKAMVLRIDYCDTGPLCSAPKKLTYLF